MAVAKSHPDSSDLRELAKAQQHYLLKQRSDQGTCALHLAGRELDIVLHAYSPNFTISSSMTC